MPATWPQCIYEYILYTVYASIYISTYTIYIYVYMNILVYTAYTSICWPSASVLYILASNRLLFCFVFFLMKNTGEEGRKESVVWIL